jgi:hypothetical protein
MAVGLFHLFRGWPTCLLSECIRSLTLECMYVSIMINVESTCAYSPQWFHLNCMYSILLSLLHLFHNVYPATYGTNFVSALSLLLLCSFIEVHFSHPYDTIGTFMVVYNFNGVSLLLVLNTCLIVLHKHWKFHRFCVQRYYIYDTLITSS